MTARCTRAMLLVLVAWTGVSTAENQEGDLQLTERDYAAPQCSPCSGIRCQNGGTCGVNGDRPECNCATNYVGFTCGIHLAHNCKTHSCLFKRSFDSGSSAGKWLFKDLHYPAVNLLIAHLHHRGAKVTLTTGYTFWGRKNHNLFFRVRFYNALYKQGQDKVVLSVDDPYKGKQVLKTVVRRDHPNNSVTKEFCITLPKTYNNFYAVSFTIFCESAKCGHTVWNEDITEIALQGLTIQEGSGCA